MATVQLDSDDDDVQVLLRLATYPELRLTPPLQRLAERIRAQLPTSIEEPTRYRAMVEGGPAAVTNYPKRLTLWRIGAGPDYPAGGAVWCDSAGKNYRWSELRVIRVIFEGEDS